MIEISKHHAYIAWLKQRGQCYPLAVHLASTGLNSSGGVTTDKGGSDVCSGCGQDVSDRSWQNLGYGGTAPRVLFLGDSPHANDDGSLAVLAEAETALLARMTAAMRLQPSDFFVTNIAHKPLHPTCGTPDAALSGCLRLTINFILSRSPELIVALGAEAARGALGAQAYLKAARGQLTTSIVMAGIPVICTFHPSELLRTPANKRLAWDDLKLAMQHLGLKEIVSATRTRT